MMHQGFDIFNVTSTFIRAVRATVTWLVTYYFMTPHVANFEQKCPFPIGVS